MNPKVRKLILLAAKMVLAAALLTWVLGQASWNDYIVTKDGKTYSLAAPPAPGKPFRVKEGRFWQTETRTLDRDLAAPVQGADELVRPGFLTSIRNIHWGMVSLAMAGFLASTLIVAVRFWFLLRIQDIGIRPWETIRLTFLGNFFNLFMPSTVGGDLFKWYFVAKHTPRKAAVMVCIFVDRILGLTELTALAGVMIVIILAAGLETYERIRYSVLAVLIVVAIVIAAMAFLLSHRFRRLFHLDKIYRRLPIAHHFEAAGDAARLFRQRLGSLVKAIGITFGAHVVWVGSIAMLGESMPSMDAVAWYRYFIYIPLIYILGAIPITPGGIGLVEKLYIVFFAAVSPSTVLALALLARFAPMIWSLPGLGVYLSGPKVPKAAAMEAELEKEAAGL